MRQLKQSIGILFLMVVACKRNDDGLQINPLDQDKGKVPLSTIDQIKEPKPTPLEPTIVELPPAPSPNPGYIDYSISGIGISLDQNAGDAKCPSLKSIKKDPLAFQIIHKAIGDYYDSGQVFQKDDVCVIAGTANLPAGYFLNVTFEKNSALSETYMRKGDALNFNYTLSSELNGTLFFARYFGHIAGPIDGINPVDLKLENSSFMSCKDAKFADSKVIFKLSLDYQLTTAIIEKNDPVGALIIETPVVNFTLAHCPVE